jgi:lysozyme
VTIDLDRLRKDLERDEGNKQRAYRCTAGKLTIGIGRNLDDKGLSKSEVLVLFNNDVRDCLADLAFFMPWYKQLDAPRQEALINMCFALGITKLRAFKNTLTALKEGDWKKAHDEALNSVWQRKLQALGSKRLIRIANTFLTGEPLYANI